MAGETTYARGSAYAKEGRVRLLSIGPAVVRAQVSGSELYSVVLEGDSDDIWGDCDCPAFDERGFCKHLVAVALTVNTASPEVMGKANESQDAIRAYLASLDQGVLVDRLMTMAAQDSKLWATLELEAAITSEDDEAIYQRVSAAMDAAMDTGEFVDWRGAGAVGEGLRGLVEQIGGLVDAGRTGLALRLLNRFFDDAPELQETVDDSDGEIGAALSTAQELHLRACLASQPDPKMLAAELFEHELEDGYGLWEDTHLLYAEALGPEGVAEFRRLAETASRASRSDRLRLRGILDGFAEADGDVDARIRLRAADASSAWDYQQIVQICLDAGREAEALKWAEEGVWKSEDRPDRHLTQLTARLLREQGQADKAQALLWRMFERSPDMDLHQALLGGGETKDDVVHRCVRVLETSLAKQGLSSWWGVPDLLVEILLKAGRTDHAWRASREHNCGDRTLVDLAEATQASHQDQALDAYVRLVERCVARTNQGAYEDAIRYLNRLAQLRSMHDRDGEHVAHVEALAVRHKMKRNFIKLLRGMPTAS
jgi:uncharacterized Zn finger protein